MKCQDVMSREVYWLLPDETVRDAARLMAFQSVGLIPICDAGGKPLGVITDRDIAIRVAAEDLLPGKTLLREVMTTDLISCAPGNSLSVAEDAMSSARVSRVLVIDPDDGTLSGIISLADIARRDSGRHTARTMKDISARETPDRSEGAPMRGAAPSPQYFHGERSPWQAPKAARPSRTATERDELTAGRWRIG